MPNDLRGKLLELAKGFPVVSLTGPRQPGRTALAKKVCCNYNDISLENTDVMLAAQECPRLFPARYQGSGIIIDEAQQAPELFSYLQEIVDESRKTGRYILTGLQNLNENLVITEHNKSQFHSGTRPSAFFWRDHIDHKVDLIIEKETSLKTIEIKSSTTLSSNLFNGLRWFSKQTGLSSDDCTLVYGSDETQDRAARHAILLRQIQDINI